MAEEWHERLLLRRTTGAMMEQRIGETPESDSVWWVVTPHGDIFPEEIASTASIDVRLYDEMGVFVPKVPRRGFRVLDPIVPFPEGKNLARLFADSLEEVESAEPSLAGGLGPITTEAGFQWKVLSRDWVGKAGEVADLVGLKGVRLGNLAIVKEENRTVAVQRVRVGEALPGPTEDAAPAAVGGGAPEDESDLRVLAVKWKGSKRHRPFEEAVALMEHFDFGDCDVEGDPTMGWYLHRILQTGLGPVARSRSWAQESAIPAGDRSVFEHHVIMKVLQVAAEKDQLNIMVLESFELLARRAQVIEEAHAVSPTNPDYSHAEDMMGWGVQRGGALVAPSLTRRAAQRASERSSILKENRKLQEEVRLRKGGRGGGDGDGRGRGSGRGKGKDKEGAAGGAGAGAAP